MTANPPAWSRLALDGELKAAIVEALHELVMEGNPARPRRALGIGTCGGVTVMRIL
jgi:hypothetical protein